MKLIILAGPGEVGKRNNVVSIKKNFAADLIYTIDRKETSSAQIKSLLLSASLFSQDVRLIIVENYPEKMNLEEIYTKDCLDTLVVVTSAGETSEFIKKARELKAAVMVFPEEKETSVFPYLDYLIEGKSQAFFELNKLLESYDWVYILTMIYYLLRRNFLPLPKSEFASKKILAQKKLVSLKDLERIYQLALETEFKIKSGVLDGVMGLHVITQKIILG